MTAQETLDQAEAALAGWQAEHAAKAAELERVASMADLDLDADPAEASVATAEQVLRLSTEVEVAANAVTEAENRVDEARRGVLRQRAADLAARAARLREIAASRQARTDELLDALEEHEGARFLAPDTAGRALALAGAGASTWKVPWTTLIRQSADGLDGRAGELTQQADEGTREQLVHYLTRPVPEPLPVEERFAKPPASAVRAARRRPQVAAA